MRSVRDASQAANYNDRWSYSAPTEMNERNESESGTQRSDCTTTSTHLLMKEEVIKVLKTMWGILSPRECVERDGKRCLETTLFPGNGEQWTVTKSGSKREESECQCTGAD